MPEINDQYLEPWMRTIRTTVDAMVAHDVAEWGNMTLGAFIQELRRHDMKAEVAFDFCYCRPTGLDSYRGYYDHLALSWEDGGRAASGKLAMTVRALLTECEEALAGKVFQGWKGGDFVMDASTPLWVANAGETGQTAVVAVQEYFGGVLIRTWHGGSMSEMYDFDGPDSFGCSEDGVSIEEVDGQYWLMDDQDAVLAGPFDTYKLAQSARRRYA